MSNSVKFYAHEIKIWIGLSKNLFQENSYTLRYFRIFHSIDDSVPIQLPSHFIFFVVPFDYSIVKFHQLVNISKEFVHGYAIRFVEIDIVFVRDGYLMEHSPAVNAGLY